MAILKPVLLGLTLGAVVTLILSVLTAKTSGFNIVTGEQMSLTGWRVIYFYLNEYGLSKFLMSLLPAYSLLAVAIAISSGGLLGGIKGSRDKGVGIKGSG